MVIKRNNKSKYKLEESININIDLATLTILCRYILAPPSFLRMTHVSNLHRLISNLNLSTYENDIDKMKRIRFINRGIEARLKYNLTDLNIILNHIYSGLDFDVDFLDMDRLLLSPDEISWCHQMVSESIQYSFVYGSTNKIIDICTRIQTSDYSHRGNLIQEFESYIDDLKNQFRKSKTEDNLMNMTFSLRDGIFEDCIQDTWNHVTNPSRVLSTGMQGFNEMLNGGFESGRVYMLMGGTSVGKSITLLNIAYQIKKYNKNFKTKDPSKRPCVVILTMENSVIETVVRLFDMVVESSNGIGMENYSVEEVINLLRTEGELVLDDDSPIDIVIKYKANRSVNTSYLYTLCDDLEDEGYEVICVIQDHVKRIRSAYGSPELRIELGDIVNEFHSFAIEKDIPVISNTHLNREGIKVIEENNNKTTKTDITKRLGKSFASESLLMFDNVDVGIVINIDYDEENNKYMAFNLDKMRGKSNRTYIVQPFVYGSKIRLMEDIGGPPMFKESLHTNMEVPKVSSIRTSSANINMMMGNITSYPPRDNIFTNDMDLEPPDLVSDDEEEEIEIKNTKVICPIFFTNPPINKPTLDDIEKFKQSLM